MRSQQRAFTLVELMVVVAILVALAALVIPMVDRQTDDAHTVVQNSSLNALRDAVKSMVSDVKFTKNFDYTNLRISDLLSASRFDASAQTWDSNTRMGWRGPYIQGGLPIQNTAANKSNLFPRSTELRFGGDTTFKARFFYKSDGTVLYGNGDSVNPELAIGDDWGNPIVLQIPTDPTLTVSGDAAKTKENQWKYARLVSAGVDGILKTDITDKLAGRKSDNSIDSSKRGDDIVIFLNRVDVYEP